MLTTLPLVQQFFGGNCSRLPPAPSTSYMPTTPRTFLTPTRPLVQRFRMCSFFTAAEMSRQIFFHTALSPNYAFAMAHAFLYTVSYFFGVNLKLK